MKKLLLIAVVAASTATMSAETFSDFFKLTYGDQVIENGQTVTDPNYYDEYAEFGIPGMTNFISVASIKATNVYDEAMDIAFEMTCVDNKTQNFQLCFEYDTAPGNCLGPNKGVIVSPSTLKTIDSDGYLQMDVHEVNITDLTPTSFKLDLWVTEGGEKVEGTDCTVYVNFTHETDITAAVEGIEEDSCEDCPPYYLTIDGAKVVHPEKGNMYIECKNGKVTKRIFK